MHTFSELRESYDSFIFKDYEYSFSAGRLDAVFHYEIPGLESFTTKWSFPAGEVRYGEVLEQLLFSLGMVEGISYYKCACPKRFVAECGSLSGDQAVWWEKLIYNGLGEFMFVNGIDVSRDELVRVSAPSSDGGVLHDDGSYDGVMVPVGGGKDSVVSLEILRGEKVFPYTVNCSAASRACIEAGGYSERCLDTKRILDKKILDMNAKGYLNGHIPFSAVLAFSALITAYLGNIKYIALSNENSANESTVRGSQVNHQYSKSYEFERDFTDYVSGITDSDIHYFSLLRPLSELQIACIFSRLSAYHRVFRSCNAGSKKGIWCCSCPKCLFVYIILSPFLSQDELEGIFGERLLDKEDMDKYFRELSGIAENKPFECVGTRAEVLACLGAYIKKGGDSLLTGRYRSFIVKNAPELSALLNESCDEVNVPEQYLEKVRTMLQESRCL